MDARLQDQAAGRRAALPGGTEGAPEHALERQLQIRVVEHDLRVLAAHLQRQPLVHAAARLTHLPPRLGGAGEGDERHVGVLHDRLADHFAGAVHELDHLGRQPRLEQDLDEHGRRVRHVLGRLEDARVPAHQRREHLPRRDRERKVERRDDAGDADRAAEAHRPLGAQLAGHGVAVQAAPFRRREVRGVDALLHVAARLGERLAHLARHEVGDLVLARRHQVADAPQHVAAGRRRRAAPELEAAPRRRHGPLHVLHAGEREAADDVARVGRIHVVEVLARGGGDPLTGNEIPEGLHASLGARSDTRRGVALSVARCSLRPQDSASRSSASLSHCPGHRAPRAETITGRARPPAGRRSGSPGPRAAGSATPPTRGPRAR